MSQPHQVIMYRNPMEYAMWNSMDGAILFPIMVSAAAAIVTVMLVGHVQNYLSRFRNKGFGTSRKKANTSMLGVMWYDVTRHFCTHLPIYAGVIAAIVTFNVMAI